MERLDVVSSNVKSVGFDPDAQVLEVEFFVPDGEPPSVYEYREVSPSGELAEIYEEMLEPDVSVGRIFHHRIKRNPAIVGSKVENAVT